MAVNPEGFLKILQTVIVPQKELCQKVLALLG